MLDPKVRSERVVEMKEMENNRESKQLSDEMNDRE